MLIRVLHSAPRREAAQDARLSPSERARVARAAPAERDAVAAALLLARLAIAESYGVDPGAVRVRRRCPRCGSADHGVPLAERTDGGPVPHLSLSRTTGLVAVALAEHGPVGVDVERADRVDLGRVALAPGERPAPGPHGLLRTWTRKEAVLKAAGTGLAVDPALLRVADAAGAPGVTTTAAALAPPAGTRWWLTDLALEHGFLAALATTIPPAAAPAVEVLRVTLPA